MEALTVAYMPGKFFPWAIFDTEQGRKWYSYSKKEDAKKGLTLLRREHLNLGLSIDKLYSRVQLKESVKNVIENRKPEIDIGKLLNGDSMSKLNLSELTNAQIIELVQMLGAKAPSARKPHDELTEAFVAAANERLGKGAAKFLARMDGIGAFGEAEEEVGQALSKAPIAPTKEAAKPAKAAKAAKAAKPAKVAKVAKAAKPAKTAKPAKAAKPAKEAAKSEGTGRGRGRPPKFLGKRIFSLLDENPRREGIPGYQSFDLILRAGKRGITYDDYIAKGGRPLDLIWDVKHGHAEARDAA